MYKLLLTLYFICYACYIFYTREPDYFDGETTHAFVTLNNKTNKATASYHIQGKQYFIDANYPLRTIENGEVVTIIYNPSKPEVAAVYSFWGYWLTWGELCFSIIALFISYQIAVSITSNPTAESLKEQQTIDDTPKAKYEF